MTTLLLFVLGYVLACTVLLAAVWWAHLKFWGRKLHVPLEYAEAEELPMPDGGVIELRRICTPRVRAADSCPVLLIHGLAMNHRNHDTHVDASFARYLCAQGRDVWLVTLRSGRSRLGLHGPAHSTFDAMALHDVPIAVETVLTRTGAKQVDIAGFSMGGMLLYASLGRSLRTDQVRRVVIFASPAKVRPLPLLGWSAILPAALNPIVPMRLWARTIACWPGLFSPLLRRLLYNPENLQRHIERHLLWNVWEDIPGRLGADFVRWSVAGQLTVDGRPVLDGLAKVDVPVCFFAGSKDFLAPEDTVRAGFEAWGRDLPYVQKHFLLLGKATGMRADYGHCDIACGRHVRDEVFEPAARFLDEGVWRPRRLAAHSEEPLEAEGELLASA